MIYKLYFTKKNMDTGRKRKKTGTSYHAYTKEQDRIIIEEYLNGYGKIRRAIRRINEEFGVTLTKDQVSSRYFNKLKGSQLELDIINGEDEDTRIQELFKDIKINLFKLKVLINTKEERSKAQGNKIKELEEEVKALKTAIGVLTKL